MMGLTIGLLQLKPTCFHLQGKVPSLSSKDKTLLSEELSIFEI